MFLLLLCLMSACGITGQAAGKKIALNQETVTVRRTKSVQLKLKGASKKVKWSSSNKSVATVTSTGKVKAHKIGQCVITATYKKKKYTCAVTVTQSAAERTHAKYPVKQYKGRILLAGSSSIARWSCASSAFAPYSIVNMAKSGTTMQQWSLWWKDLIVPYKPKAVIWYVGGNDLWKKTTPAKTAKLFCETVKKLHKALPDTQIYFVSVYTNINRKSISKNILAYNKKVKQFCSGKKYITYIDLATKFNNNRIPLELLLCDGLHPNEAGYKIWDNVIATKVKSDMKKMGIVTEGTVTVGSGCTSSTGSSGSVSTETEIYVNEILGELSQAILK